MLGWRNSCRSLSDADQAPPWRMHRSRLVNHACVVYLFCVRGRWGAVLCCLCVDGYGSRVETRGQSKYSRRWPSTADHWTHHISTVASFACRLPTDTAMGPETSGRALLRTVCTACYCAGFLATVQQCVATTHPTIPLPGRFLLVVFLQPSYSRFRFHFHFRSIGWATLSRRSLQPVALAGPFRRTKVSGLSSGFRACRAFAVCAP
jgi:hypothetical protein